MKTTSPIPRDLASSIAGIICSSIIFARKLLPSTFSIGSLGSAIDAAWLGCETVSGVVVAVVEIEVPRVDWIGRELRTGPVVGLDINLPT